MGTQHIAKAKAVKVTLGSAGGNRIAQIVRTGDVIPDGVDEESLKRLVKRGLIEKVKTADSKGEEIDEGAYKAVSVADLKSELEKRNKDRADDVKIVAAEPGNRPQIVAALIADDNK